MDGPFNVYTLRDAIRAAGLEWQAEENELTRLSPQQQRLYLGYTPDDGEPSLHERSRIAAANSGISGASGAGVPNAIDLRNVGGNNFITPVRNQRACGSCVAFGTVAAVEGTVSFRRNSPDLDIDRSEADLFYCIGAGTADCGVGWYVTAALTGLQNPGVPDEACFPYVAGNQACQRCADWAARAYRIAGWAALGTLPDMKAYISANGPLVACFTVYQDFYAYTSGVYQHVSGTEVGGHCICVVGYDDGAQCWICKNSWGPAWGDAGYFRIRYGEVGIDALMWSVDAP